MKDYHGSRSYESDEHVPGQLSLMMAWMSNIARTLFGSGPRPSSSDASLLDGDRQFSLLGTGGGGNAHDEGTNPPFPTRSTPADNDWRVLP